MTIRKTTMNDLTQALEIYAGARAYMAKNGNPDQWGQTNPPAQQIVDDINHGKSYVCEKDGQIIAVFYFAVEEEPTYRVLYEGNWLDDSPYGVLHRVAVAQQEQGVGSQIAKWALSQHPNIRIDTHENNVAMQKMLAKNDFSYCGKIIIGDGTERLAFQRVL